MTRTSARALVGAAAALALFTASPAMAAGHGDHHGRGGHHVAQAFTYALPGTDVFPEGVDTFGRFFYVTSTTDGTVFRGVVGSRTSAKVFLPGRQNGRTIGVGIEATRDLLIVAGGDTGRVFVYDRSSGRFLGSHFNGLTSGTFINDIAVAPNGDVYATDSAQQDVVYRIPARQVRGSSTLDVFASFSSVDPTGAFNANGIVVTSHGRYLIVVQSDTGLLYRVSTRTGAIRRINLGGSTLTNGDGLEIKGHTVYVVRNSPEVVAKVRLNGRLTRGALVEETTDPTFQLPTTAALDRGRLLVVNSQFDQRGADPVEPFTVSSIKRP